MPLSYRQVILKVFRKTQDALRILDIGPETLETVETQTVTVSTTLLKTGSWFPTLSGDEQVMSLQVISGGPINVNASLADVVTAGGAEGSQQASAGDFINVTGPKDISRFQTIRATGGSDAEVRAVLSRRPA